jgi:hypothetical protein
MEKQYGDHTIGLTENMQFKVSGPLFADDYRGYTTFETYREAQDAIDKREKAQEAQERVKLSISVLNDKGETVTITGVHARNYNALGVGDTQHLYPVEQWIIDMIRERDATAQKSKDLTATLNRYSIEPKAYTDRSHEQAVARIQCEVEAKARAAAERRAA